MSQTKIYQIPSPVHKVNFDSIFKKLILEKFIAFGWFDVKNNICVPESFNTNISHKLFDSKITFVNSIPSARTQFQKVIL